jgi:hypothetical protein
VTIWNVYRWRGSRGWVKDTWEQNDPEGHFSKAEAQAAVAQLLADHLRYRKKPMYPPAIAWTETPRMRPRAKEQKHRYTAAELNGHTYRGQTIPEETRP